jgi:hypothetical protein
MASRHGTRYAIYYAPAPGSTWARFGADWLGPRARSPDGIPQAAFDALTYAARRYGFHATLKAPFRLADGVTLNNLVDAARAIAQRHNPIELPALVPGWRRGALALLPERRDARLDALAADCVLRLDRLRAPMTDAERAHRLRVPLSARELELLARWGYPQVLDRWQFHITLSAALDDSTLQLGSALVAAAWTRLPADRPLLDSLAIFEEPAAEQRLHLLERISLVPAPHGAFALHGMRAAQPA